MTKARKAWLASLTSLALAKGATCPAADTLFVSDFFDGIIYRFDLPSPVPQPIVNGLILPEDGDCSPAGLIYFPESSSVPSVVTRWNQDGTGAQEVIPAAGVVNGPEGLTFDLAGNMFLNTRNMGATCEGGWKLDGGDPSNVVTQILGNFSDWGEGSVIPLAGPHQGAWLLVARGELTVYISEPPGAPLTVLIPASAFPPPPADIHLYGIATNGCGDVFVAFSDMSSANGSAVYHFDPDGNFIEVYLGNLGTANFLDFDSSGDLYVADPSTTTVWKVKPDRSVSAFASTFSQPVGIAICRTRRVPDCPTAITCDSGGPYAAECDGAATCLAVDGSGSTGINLEYAWATDCPGGVFDDPTKVKPQLCLQSAACPTRCTATLTVSAGSNSQSCTAAVQVEDTLPPALAGVPPDVTVECDAVPPPPAVTASDRCDPDVPVDFAEVRKDGKCAGDYTLTRTWSASDDCGHGVSEDQIVTAVDTTPPDLGGSTDDRFCLWPPNHWYVCFDLDDLDLGVDDSCSDPVTWRFSGCASDQPDDARESDATSPWNGDGHTVNDCVVLPDGKGICVRSERAGTGPNAQDGRHYGIGVIATDACGNESKPVVVGNIHVPHDQSPAEKACVDPTEDGCQPNQPIPCPRRKK